MEPRDLLLRLDGAGPRYAQITRAVSRLIQSGALQPGARVPPSRELARDLACARNVVLIAYEQLTLEGYFIAKRGAGTFVSPALPPRRPTRAAPISRVPLTDPLSVRGRRLVALADEARRRTLPTRQCAIDFIYGVCEPDPAIAARLRKALAVAVRSRPFAYPPTAGDADLKQQIANRLRAARGIARPPEQLLITSGAQQALEICARLLVDDGDRVVVEEPGYEGASTAFLAAGADLVRIPVDRHGLNPAALPNDGPPVRAVYVTPSHQFPTGAVMPAARRLELLAWARRRGALIIEDDYDGEYRYAGRRIAALAAFGPAAPVIYCGTFAKSLFASLRLGYLALPPELVVPAQRLKWLCDRGSPTILQRAVGELMATGEYDRHIRRMQRRYQARRDALVRALRTHLGAAAEVQGLDAGLHLIVSLPRLHPNRVDELVDACDARGVGVYSLARHATQRVERATLILGYGLVDLAAIEPGIRILGEAYRQLAGANRSRRRA